MGLDEYAWENFDYLLKPRNDQPFSVLSHINKIMSWYVKCDVTDWYIGYMLSLKGIFFGQYDYTYNTLTRVWTVKLEII